MYIDRGILGNAYVSGMREGLSAAPAFGHALIMDYRSGIVWQSICAAGICLHRRLCYVSTHLRMIGRKLTISTQNNDPLHATRH